VVWEELIKKYEEDVILEAVEDPRFLRELGVHRFSYPLLEKYCSLKHADRMEERRKREREEEEKIAKQFYRSWGEYVIDHPEEFPKYRETMRRLLGARGEEHIRWVEGKIYENLKAQHG
jgi:hypothetical protein